MKIAVAFLTALVLFYVEGDGDGLKCHVWEQKELKDCNGVCVAFNPNTKKYSKMVTVCQPEYEAIPFCQEAEDDAKRDRSEAFCYYCGTSGCNNVVPSKDVISYFDTRKLGEKR